jgi:FAD/FMN-containing dehydrogenase
MIDFERRRLMLASSAALAGVAVPAASVAQHRIVMNDASGLSPTPVFSHRVLKFDSDDGLVAALRTELRSAASQNRPLVVGAARHSMGGQSLARNGSAITFAAPSCEVDRASGVFRVQAGTRWHEAIRVLDALNASPAVMQSNSDFSVGATFSVNAHGWPAPYGPFGSTVRAIRLMLSDGSIVTCSRTENAELFSLAMGGYGLVGILLDLEVELVPNTLMRPNYERMDANALGERFMKALGGSTKVKMLYGRLNVARADFFTEALLVTYREEPTPPEGLPPVTRQGALTGLTRSIYRAQIGSEKAKRARWLAETQGAPRLGSGIATRNTLLNEPVANLGRSPAGRTDILHEYFVPPARFNAFLAACRQIIPKAKAEFLNVTLRFVARDDTSLLSFAPTDRIAAVMSFSQAMTPEGEADMLLLTEALIERVASLGGSYYLPYRLHARVDQFHRVYDGARRFAERKHHYDPGLLFRNALWDNYLAA